jgi:hypothetical protein
LRIWGRDIGDFGEGYRGFWGRISGLGVSDTWACIESGQRTVLKTDGGSADGVSKELVVRKLKGGMGLKGLDSYICGFVVLSDPNEEYPVG